MTRAHSSNVGLTTLRRFLVGLVPVTATLLVTVGGCGGRGPLDEATNVVAEESDSGTEETATDASDDVDASAPAETTEDAGVLACGACILGRCEGSLFSCIRSSSCRSVFQCVSSTCLGGGGLETSCLFQCAQGDPAGALEALSVLQCVQNQCGDRCSSWLGGLGNFGGN